MRDIRRIWSWYERPPHWPTDGATLAVGADRGELIAVYEVADAAILYQNRDRISEMFLRAVPVTRAGAENFAMDAFTAWFSWTDPSRLLVPSRRRSTTSPSDPRKARRAADDLLLTLRTALSNPDRNPLLREIGPHHLVPPSLRPVDVQPVFHREAKAFDHWLCRYSVTLPLRRRPASRPPAGPLTPITDAATSAALRGDPTLSEEVSSHRTAGSVTAPGSTPPSSFGDVLGSAIEVRVDPDARVVGYTSRVTPLTGRNMLVPLVPLPEHDDGDGHEYGSEAIVYLQDNFRMTRLLPYFLTQTGHHRGLYPASTHSLLVDILQRNSAYGAELGTVILGGSGSFRVEWFSWQPDTVLIGDGIARHGEGLVIRVGPGVYNMTAVVHDVRYGAHVEFSKLLFVPIPATSGYA